MTSISSLNILVVFSAISFLICGVEDIALASKSSYKTPPRPRPPPPRQPQRPPQSSHHNRVLNAQHKGAGRPRLYGTSGSSG
uniref:Uncharacterized protein n=1 Tax=Rhipicephalus appendiculatus TaxID=34631 RepID=A0A131YA84_RHIAP